MFVHYGSFQKSLTKLEQNILQMQPDFLLSLLCTNDRSVVFLFLKAISLEPHLLDAYWHRHSIYLQRNDPDRALDDLNVIVKNNKNHAGVCMSPLSLTDSRRDKILMQYSRMLSDLCIRQNRACTDKGHASKQDCPCFFLNKNI